MSEGEVKFKIKVNRMYERQWSFGINLSHMGNETYIHINLFKIGISIGLLEDY